MFLFIIVFITALIIALYYQIHQSREGRLLSKIPGPRPHPIIGHAVHHLKSPPDLFNLGRQWSKEYENGYMLMGGFKRAVFIFDLDDVQHVLTNPKLDQKSEFYDFLQPWLNEGLLIHFGKKRKERRKIISHAFHSNILQQFCTVFEEHADKLVSRLHDDINKEETDVIREISNTTLNIICQTAMGVDLEKITDIERKYAYRNAIFEVEQSFIQRVTRVWLHSWPIFNLSSTGRKQNDNIKTLKNFTDKVINEKRANNIAIGNGIIESTDEEYMKMFKKRMALLDLLLCAESEGKIDDSGIREEVDTFTFAGHDTTTVGLSYCLMLLANHPKSQDLIVSEINDIFGNSNGPATISQLNELNYMERCIKESLRIYPPVPLIGRYAREDTQLKRFVVPRNTTVMMPIIDIHRNGKLYPEPEKFDPDRFLDENIEKRHPFAYIPFSFGSRNCIGKRFAMLEMKITLMSILKKFKLISITRPEDIVHIFGIVLSQEDPIKIKFVPRVQ